MLWIKFYFCKFEALRQNFYCNIELIKAELRQRCLMTNLDKETSKKSVSLKENFHCIDDSSVL